jgi:Fe2+ or Zn2+ uptake regulation protein
VTASEAGRILAGAGIEATPIRLAVLAAMADEGRAVSAAEILAAVRRARPANKVTVYRALDLFVEKGVALRHALEDRAFRYCLGAAHGSAFHCHVWCRLCGRMECVSEAAAGLGPGALGDRLGMDVMGVEMRIDGICRQCRRAGEDGSPPRPSR